MHVTSLYRGCGYGAGCLDGGGTGVGIGCTKRREKNSFVSLFLKTRFLNYPVSAVAHPSSCGQPSRQSWRRGTTMRRLPAGITSAASSTIADATTCTLVRLTAGKSECCRMLLGKCVPGNIYTLIYYLFIIPATVCWDLWETQIQFIKILSKQMPLPSISSIWTR